MFDTKSAQDAGKRSGLARRRAALEHSRRYEAVQELIRDVPTDDLPVLWHAISIDLALHVVRGDLPEVGSSADVERYVNAADKLHKMGRLAAGQSTSNAATLHVDASMMSALEEKVARLRSQGAHDVESSRPTPSDENA